MSSYCRRAANNQLGDEQKDGDFLAKRGILYAPDFVVNAGGVINVGAEIELGGYHAKAVREKIDGIYDQLVAIYSIAEQNGCSTAEAANSLAEYRLQYKIGKRESAPHF